MRIFLPKQQDHLLKFPNRFNFLLHVRKICKEVLTSNFHSSKLGTSNVMLE